MKKIAMKDGDQFILDTNDVNYQMYINLLEKHHDYQICDAKDINEVTLYYNCKAYFDSDGEYEIKDGRSFHLDYDLIVLNKPNFPISKEITKQSYDGKDGINFTLPISVSLDGIINVASDFLSKLYPEEDKPVGVVEPEYIYAIYSYRIDCDGDKKVTLPYYTEDINAVNKLLNIENDLYKLYANKRKKEEWYEVSEIDIKSNKHTVDFIKSTTEKITLEDVKNIIPRVKAYLTNTYHDGFEKYYSSEINATFYAGFFPIQPKLKYRKSMSIEHIDTYGNLHIENVYDVNLKDSIASKFNMFYSLIEKAKKKIIFHNAQMLKTHDRC